MAKLSTWCFEHSGDISCSLLVNPSHTDESWEGRNTCMWILYIYYIYTYLNNIYLYKERLWIEKGSSRNIFLKMLLVFSFIYIYIVLQIRDFQLVGQWAEGLKGVLRPELVQQCCLFLLPKNTKMVKIGVDLFYITFI